MARQNFTWQAGLVFEATNNEVLDLGTRTYITSKIYLVTSSAVFREASEIRPAAASP